ncbi:cytochrome c551 [Polymorphobacter glacialis]|uniref:Cytochrome c551 n=1 Tax=Sandarakinorhabdus glacialis TaxID=1614636 RepID=A0A916ZZH6_9SPHN|nr:cation transporter [Polymorphobacter glacialis]GGE19607.1 cytochrome c551 [Polymorphobacter glacialis]
MVSQRRARAVTALRSALEASLLQWSIVATVFVAAAGVIIGLLAGSMSIVFDGLFSVVDAAVTVLTLIVARLLASEGNHRFQYGYWHLEPLVMALNSSILIFVCGYAFLNAVMGLMSGGQTPAFGIGIVYAVVVGASCFFMVFYLKARNERIESELIGLEIQGWLMAGVITLALLLAFCGGLLLKGTPWQWVVPYVDPAVLALLAPVLLLAPLQTARQAFGEIFLITSKAVHIEIKDAVAAVLARHGFHDFQSYAVEVGRARFIEVSILVPPDMPARPVAEFDEIRHEVGNALGGIGPELWLTIMFTGDPELV